MLCLLLLVPVAVFAQTTGTVEGLVTDQSNAALPGVTVELTGVRLQGTKTGVTAADGRYRFLNLVPGDYVVTATLAGFGSVQKKATVTLDATATANLQLALSTTAEVTVTGEAPLIDSTSTTAGSNFSGKVISKLPLASRNYASIVLSQPGVQIDGGESQGRSPSGAGGMMGGGISVYGSTSAENSFLIDGVNTTNVIKGIQGKDINNEFVQEVEVKTGGYQAEYGRNTGGIVNVITKSGGNEFHGDVFGYYNSLDLGSAQKNATTPDFSELGNAQSATIANKNTRSEGGLDLGGFMVKDRVWFFAAYDRVSTDQEFAPTAGITEGVNFPDTITENKYSLK
ncbi:MAG TPA: carboxypeptidase regulatory-like domain-containing protein, partial [Thermoanaerobaculia bacterium]|nr:carboxypeptidase regulatory-like domain-containing protein [Thermoanaerobaculia bacterium]